MRKLEIDPYVHTVLLRDLVGHDHRPASFLVYLWLYLEQQRCNGAGCDASADAGMAAHWHPVCVLLEIP